MKILIIEDDRLIKNLLKNELEKWGYDISLVDDFNKTTEIFNEEKPHLVIMDIKLPVYDGYYFTRQIRSLSDIPIIFMSSKSDNMDQIMAIEMGADDFIVKPFDMNFAISKIKAVFRRTYTYDNKEVNLNRKFTFDPIKLEFSYQNEKIELTKTENTILNLLINNINEFVTRNDLMEACWQGDDYIDDNTLFVSISRLRKKMLSIGLENVIETKKSVGYRFNEENI